MPLALGRLVLITLGCFGPLRGTLCAEGVQSDKNSPSSNKAVSWDTPVDHNSNGLSAGFLDGFALTEATGSRPSHVGFRRPQFELQKRDGTCLANGTNFCFGDASSFCSSCGTCCSSTSNKWCCPSDGICCGSSCCASGQTCSNGQCYLPIVTVTSTSLVSTTVTQVATKMVTIVLQVIENSLTNVIVTVTNTNAETQTNWQYVTVTGTLAKRAVPTDEAVHHPSHASPATVPAMKTASRTTTAKDFIAPTLSNELIQELVKRQQVEDTKNTMDPSKSTTVVQIVVTTTAIVSSTALTTTTVQTSSVVISTTINTVTAVINAKTTVDSTSTITSTPRKPVTRTLTEVATIPFSASLSLTSTSSTKTSPVALQTTSSVVKKKGLAAGAIAGISVGAAVGAIAAGMLAFFCLRRHRSNKKVRQSISEDYAYLGTGRSESASGPGMIHTNSGVPAMQQATVGYTGPASPAAVAIAGGRPRQVTLQSDDHGLPPTPNFTRMPTKRSARSSTSANSASSPTSATSQSLPFGSDAMQQSLGLGVAPNGSNGRKSHARSGSALTALTASSTLVGGSARNSVQSTPGMTKAPFAAAGASGGQRHKRDLSSGSGVTVENLTESSEGDSEDSPDRAPGSSAASPTTPSPPLASAERSSTSPAPDPPSPYLEPRLGPLRIVNIPATPPTVPSIPEFDSLDLDPATLSRSH